MSDYTVTTDFQAKDSLPSGNAGKVVKGSEFTVEFNAIAVAIATKANIASPTFTGTPAAPTAAAGTNTTQLATTAYVQGELGTYAPKASPTFTGVATFAAGAVGAPSITFTGDTNTGLYASAADTVDVAVGGVRGFQVATAASAVNYVQVLPSATGVAVKLNALGTDTNIDLSLVPKGSGLVKSTTGFEAATKVVAKQFGTTEYDAGNSSTAITLDFSTNGQNQKVTLTGNAAITLSNGIAGQTSKIKLVQDGTGGRTVTWATTVKWPGGTAPTITTTAAAVDFITLYYDGSAWWGTFAQAFA